MEEDTPVVPDYTFDFDSMNLDHLVSAHQEGDYLVGLTNTGTHFRHHLPVGKILTKDAKGDWKLIDTILR